ncbi:hypothetical protein [Ureibacillus manganicus]|uniref:Uncharacterized protein n=1 Tax=Ureibacillus manganicus DSM 26584 TaxID=1384049 RepID=A0A0A3ILI3_9BACL|nr:hypothetical protein [Ureibacillus manganicus]KGR75692.1 hypothetical protein CD29_17825 [Ureibacillus manganicus DSM 26584]
MKRNKQKRHFYICLVISVIFTINLVRSYMDTGEIPMANLIITAAVYIATILSTYTLKKPS